MIVLVQKVTENDAESLDVLNVLLDFVNFVFLSSGLLKCVMSTLYPVCKEDSCLPGTCLATPYRGGRGVWGAGGHCIVLGGGRVELWQCQI